jgi:hypothetical protein
VACHTSPPPRKVPQATSPLGERVTLALPERTYVGELLAVTDSTVILMIDNRVALARGSAVLRVVGPGFALTFDRGAKDYYQQLDRARHGSRYPYGISPEVFARLLAATSQSAPFDLTPPSR